MQLPSTILKLFANQSKDRRRLLLLEVATLLICIPFVTVDLLREQLTLGGAANFLVQTSIFVFLLDYCFFTLFPYLWVISFPNTKAEPPSELANKSWTIKQKRKIFLKLTSASLIISVILYLANMNLGASWALVVALIFLAHMV